MVALALIPFAIGFVALLNPPAEQAGVWLLASLALTYLGFSAATVAYQAWGADVGGDSTQRTRLTAAREGFGLLGVVLAAALPSLLAGSLNEGIARLSWILPPLLLIAAITTFSRVGVGLPVLAATEALLPSLRLVFADLAFRRLLIVFVANGIAAALPATLFLFFVADVLQLESASGPLLAIYFIAGAASLPLWVKFATRYGRVTAWLVAMVLAIFAFAGASLLGSGDLWPFALICIASGLALGADLALPAAIAADLGERQGRVGACFGVWNFVAKLNLALAAGLSLPLLGSLGYVPGSGNGLVALTLAYALLPLAFKALAGVLLWRWRHSLELES
jgi:Na+/melibiose symporter-like transporter